MTVDDVRKYYVNGFRMSKKHGFSPRLLNEWRDKGYVPIVSQMRIERLTDGELKADLSHCPRGEQ